MNEYPEFKKIVKKYLNGELQDIDFEESNHEEIKVTTTYIDNYGLWNTYELKYNKFTHKYYFISHFHQSTLEKLDYPKNSLFEKHLMTCIGS